MHLSLPYCVKVATDYFQIRPIDITALFGRLLFNLIDYIELVDWTGRVIRDDKRGAISATAPPILQRLDISTKHWIELTTKFEQRFKGIAGSAQSIKALCAHFGLTRTINRGNTYGVRSCGDTCARRLSDLFQLRNNATHCRIVHTAIVCYFLQCKPS